MAILVTGAAGFIGFHVSQALLHQGVTVVGIDDLNAYYDVSLKEARLRILNENPAFRFRKVDLTDKDGLSAVFAETRFSSVINLAAQAGVRYSLVNPRAYTRSNIDGFLNVLEECRNHQIGHLVYASSSSVYGAVTQMPFSVHQNVDHPISLYAATKKSNELMAHSYSHLFQLPVTGLRFFTVYGPWGRPDMAMFLFTRAILAGTPINIFNYGKMRRDFTYIDDIAQAVATLSFNPAQPNAKWSGLAPDPGSSLAPYRIYNIGNHDPVDLMRVIEALEECLGRKAIKNFVPMQPGDVSETYADVADLQQAVGFAPNTPIEVGIERFVRWYREFYKT